MQQSKLIVQSTQVGTRKQIPVQGLPFMSRVDAEAVAVILNKYIVDANSTIEVVDHETPLNTRYNFHGEESQDA